MSDGRIDNGVSLATNLFRFVISTRRVGGQPEPGAQLCILTAQPFAFGAQRFKLSPKNG